MSTATKRALIGRINRKLAHRYERLHASKGRRQLSNLGAYYLVDVYRNAVINWGLDPIQLGRELGVLRENEEIR